MEKEENSSSAAPAAAAADVAARPPARCRAVVVVRIHARPAGRASDRLSQPTNWFGASAAGMAMAIDDDARAARRIHAGFQP